MPEREKGCPDEMPAILTLLQDDDDCVASLAMEHLLSSGESELRDTVAEYQEATNPLLRHRIHQLSSILSRRQGQTELIREIKNNSLASWETACQLNRLYGGRHYSQPMVDEEVSRLLDGCKEANIRTVSGLAGFLRDQRFSVADKDDMFDIRLHMIQEVLLDRWGSEVVLCVLMQHLGTRLGWNSAIVVYHGTFCLIDSQRQLVEPLERWRLVKLDEKEAVHACSRRDVFLAMLSQLFMASTVEGSLRDLYQFGSQLSLLREAAWDDLPYPLGNVEAPECAGGGAPGTGWKNEAES
jgi:hypothetical protein